METTVGPTTQTWSTFGSLVGLCCGSCADCAGTRNKVMLSVRSSFHHPEIWTCPPIQVVAPHQAFQSLFKRSRKAVCFLKTVCKAPVAKQQWDKTRDLRRQRQAKWRIQVRARSLRAEEKDRMALSIRQPFASLIAWGIKRFEGRNKKLVSAGGTFWVCSSSSSCGSLASSKSRFLNTLRQYDCPELTARLGNHYQDLTESDLLALFPRGVVLARATVGAQCEGSKVSKCSHSFALQLSRVEPVPVFVHVKGQCGIFHLCGKTADLLLRSLRVDQSRLIRNV